MRKLLATATLSFLHGYLQAGTEIPIYKQEIPLSGSEQKIAYGIYVKIGDGGAPRLFQLDTGNGSFLAGYASGATGGNQFWGTYDSLGSSSYQSSFGSGVTMNYYEVTAQVTLSDPGGADLATIPSMALGQVYDATGPSSGNWQQDLENGVAPLHQTYYGNFGAGLYSRANSTPGYTPLFSALGQITNATGFVLSLSGSNPKLTVMFDTPEDRAIVNAFPHATSMAAGDGQLFPVTNWQTSTEFPVTAASFHADGLSSEGTTGLFDTGGVSFLLPDSAASEFDSLISDGNLVSGVDFRTRFAVAGVIDGVDYSNHFSVGFTTGGVPGVDAVSVDNEWDELNFGPSIYNYYDVYFDLKYQTIRFSPVPEPGPCALLATGLPVLFLRRCRRKSSCSLAADEDRSGLGGPQL